MLEKCKVEYKFLENRIMWWVNKVLIISELKNFVLCSQSYPLKILIQKLITALLNVKQRAISDFLKTRALYS